MSASAERLLRRKMPKVHRRIDGESWIVSGRTGGGHIWLKHLASGRRVTAPSSASDYRAERNLMKLMDRFEQGRFDER